jgi:hypothetical protein
MSTKSFPTRVTEAKSLLEEAAAGAPEDLRAERMANLQEAIEFLRRLETSFQNEQTDD